MAPPRRKSAAGAGILERVGLAVRHWRGVRGLTRRELEAASGVSARFLADLEAGRGNISLRRLDDLARALDVPPARLLEGVGGARGERLNGKQVKTTEKPKPLNQPNQAVFYFYDY